MGARLPKRGGGEGCCGRTQLGRCSGKHTRRRTVRSPNDVAATGVRGLLVRSFVTGYGAVGGGRARTWEAVGLNAKRACNDPSPPAFRA